MSPIVVSVPKNTKCRAGVETSTSLEAVGALAIMVALVDVAVTEAASHSKHGPLKI